MKVNNQQKKKLLNFIYYGREKLCDRDYNWVNRKFVS